MYNAVKNVLDTDLTPALTCYIVLGAVSYTHLLLNKAGKIRHVQLGEEMGLGTADLSKLNIRRISMA